MRVKMGESDMYEERGMVMEVEVCGILAGEMLSCMRERISVCVMVVVLMVVVGMVVLMVEVGVVYLGEMNENCSEVAYFMMEVYIFELVGWEFCVSCNGNGSGQFRTVSGGCCEAGLVVFEWEREFLVML